MPSSMALVYNVLATIRSSVNDSGQLSTIITGGPVEDVKSILDTAARRQSTGCIIAYPRAMLWVWPVVEDFRTKDYVIKLRATLRFCVKHSVSGRPA